MPRKPVFFDPSQKRWRAAKRQGLVAAILLAALLVVLAGGIMDDPPLADMHLRSPVQSRLSRLRAPNQKPRPKAPERAGQRGDASVAQAAAPGAARGAVPRRFAYFVNWDDNSLSSLRANVNAIDVLVPEWLHLRSASGDIAVDNQRRQDEALALVAHAAHPPRVTPLINNVANDTWQGAALDAALADPGARARMIDQLWRFVTVNRFAGISIDFEDMGAAHARDLETFMAALYARFHPAGLTVSISIPAEDDTYRADVLGRFADQVFLMEYDEHASTDQPGPIASQPWFDRTVAERMDELDPSKIVIGLGGYAYDWTLGKRHAEELTFQETLRLAQQAQATIALDPSARNPTFRYDDEQGKPHAVWYLDAVTAYNEIASAAGRHPYGFAIWRLGAEDPSLWRLFEHPEAMTGPRAAARLRDLNFRYDIEFGGTGEVLRVTSVPSPGLRDITLDRGSGLIDGESVPRFPSGYGISRWGYRNKTVVLSFDDGPDPLYTPRILDILKRYGVHGCFFIVGMNAQAYPDLLRRIYDEGNEIGSHTFTHPNMSNVSPLQTTFELNATDRLLETVIGHDTVLFRPPYAEDMEPQTPEQVAPLMRTSEMGYYTVGMNIDPRDWATPGVDNIVSKVLEGARRGDGNVVLLHDSGGDREQTVAALPRIIEGLKAEGFRFATVGDLLGKPRDAVMPKVPAGMAPLVASQRVAFTVLRYLRDGLTLLFGTGVVLGIGRAVLIAGLAFMPRRPLPESPDPRIKVSVVVPAYNEEKVIVSTVRSLLASTYPNLDILVVDDGSSDGTAAAVRAAFARERRVRLITKPNGGKAEALNLGFNSTDADVVVALDADTMFQPDTVANLVRHFSNPAVGAVAGNAKVGNRVNLLTRWQALEYITSQNLDRRAFDRLQCISVVPGAVGAWRREAVLALGGFGGDTLAEDADLTLRIIRAGYRVEYDDAALALTEAPETIGAFLKQRFRWMFGTLQAVWKHRDALLRRRAGTVGLVALPNVLVFQIFFPLISPIVDLTMLLSLAEMGMRALGHSEDPVGHGFGGVLACYLLFLAADYLATALAFLYERGEQKSLLLWLFFQRFFYRQLIYYVAIKAMLTALRGSMVGWNKLERTATVPASAAWAKRDEAA